jgi:hypothetical protein
MFVVVSLTRDENLRRVVVVVVGWLVAVAVAVAVASSHYLTSYTLDSTVRTSDVGPT